MGTLFSIAVYLYPRMYQNHNMVKHLFMDKNFLALGAYPRDQPKIVSYKHFYLLFNLRKPMPAYGSGHFINAVMQIS